MDVLEEGRVSVTLSPGKPTGLGELGIPSGEGTRVLRGKAQEFAQSLAGGGVGRMFQNIRVIAARAPVGGMPVGKLFVLLEVFGDNTVPQGAGNGIALGLNAGDQHLMNLPPSLLFMPYPNCWYDNRFVFDLPDDLFDQLDRVDLIAGTETVAVLASA